MKLTPITRANFSLWSDYRSQIYPLISREYDLAEMEILYGSDNWHCWFIEAETGTPIGLVELSLRNIADGCLSSPVPYLEGLYLVEAQRGQGRGASVIELIKRWCIENGYSELATDAELSNVRAQHFYESLGFEQVDRVVEYRLEIKTG